MLHHLTLFRVTRTLFVFAELTNLDPNYNGPSFNFDSIIRELIDQVMETFNFLKGVPTLPSLTSYDAFNVDTIIRKLNE